MTEFFVYNYCLLFPINDFDLKKVQISHSITCIYPEITEQEMDNAFNWLAEKEKAGRTINSKPIIHLNVHDVCMAEMKNMKNVLIS